MKLHTLLMAAMLASGVVHAAETIVKSADIAAALTAVPKAIQDSSGRWLQRDPSIDLQVQFDFNKSALSPQGQQQLDELAAALRQPALQAYAFEVAGHTDKAGTAAYNLKLSAERAQAARAYMMARHGIAGERILAKGYGYERLADPAQPEAAINRRVEIRRLPPVAAAALPVAPAAAAPLAPAPAGQALPPTGGTIGQRQ